MIAHTRPGASQMTLSGAIPGSYNVRDLGVMSRAQFYKALVRRTLDEVFGCRVYNPFDNSRANQLWDVLIATSMCAREKRCDALVRSPYHDYKLSMGTQFRQCDQLLKLGWMYGAGSPKVWDLRCQWFQEDQKQDSELAAQATPVEARAPPPKSEPKPVVEDLTRRAIETAVKAVVEALVSAVASAVTTIPMEVPVGVPVAAPVTAPAAIPEDAPKVVPAQPRQSSRAPAPAPAKVFAVSSKRHKNRVKPTLGTEAFPRGDVVAAFDDFRKTRAPTTKTGPSGFTFECRKRASGASAGGLDFYAYAACGKRFRSKRELCLFWNPPCVL